MYRIKISSNLFILFIIVINFLLKIMSAFFYYFIQFFLHKIRLDHCFNKLNGSNFTNVLISFLLVLNAKAFNFFP